MSNYFLTQLLLITQSSSNADDNLSWWTVISESAKSIKEGVVDKTDDLVSSANNTITHTATATIHALGSTSSATGQVIGKLTTNTIHTTGSILSKTGDGISDAATGTIDALGSTASTIGQVIGELTTNTIHTTGSILSKTGDGISDAAKQATHLVGVGIENLFKVTTQGFFWVLGQTFKGMVGGVVESARNDIWTIIILLLLISCLGAFWQIKRK